MSTHAGDQAEGEGHQLVAGGTALSTLAKGTAHLHFVIGVAEF